jgi:hypothetical protein
MRRGFASALVLLAACAVQSAPAGPRAFERWLAADASRAPAFARFEALLEREGVSGVVTNRELWLTDRLAPECVVEPFVLPPEELWSRIVPTLRYIRDFVKPAVGELRVASAYRDDAFNACVQGASRSAHREYLALDLVPKDARVTRERLIALLCPIHAREGPRRNIGMGIYRARRFHIDARGYRGWGEDHRGTSFPCAVGG